MIDIQELWEVLRTPIEFHLGPGATIADLVILRLKERGIECSELEQIAKASRRGEGQRVQTFEKQKQGGLRRCPGHKKEVVYKEKNGVLQCNICGGYKYE